MILLAAWHDQHDVEFTTVTMKMTQYVRNAVRIHYQYCSTACRVMMINDLENQALLAFSVIVFLYSSL